ncbi:hypothetical protein M407DRAFT_100651 [Tulasnella calospora MUT 4182]|uniref:Uncharacterized protein n=1 Tax=Tulasnella calospora MUT 4182 TaxID=1051891 RepID=A0A0C3QJU2_9AGAM|nr:hypothetical protein M407DRAFT_100651 [Tulasnella calospora MUT 4182]
MNSSLCDRMSCTLGREREAVFVPAPTLTNLFHQQTLLIDKNRSFMDFLYSHLPVPLKSDTDVVQR